MVFLLAKTHQESDLTFGHEIEKSEKKTEKTSLSRCNGCLQSLVTSQSVWFRLHIPTKMTLAERKNFINSAQRWFIYSVKGKVQMGYKMCTPGVQIFVGYKRSKWGTVGNPGRISAVICRNPFSRIPTVGYDRSCIQSDRIPARFCRIPT